MRYEFTDIFIQVSRLAEMLAKTIFSVMVTKELPCALHFLFLFKMGIELDVNDSDKPMCNGMYCWIQEMARGQKTFTELAAQPRNAGRLILIFQPLLLY